MYTSSNNLPSAWWPLTHIRTLSTASEIIDSPAQRKLFHISIISIREYILIKFVKSIPFTYETSSFWTE